MIIYEKIVHSKKIFLNQQNTNKSKGNITRDI